MKNGILLSLLVLGGSLSAQTYITSPKGYLTTEGSSSHNYMIFAKHEMRWQSIDQSHIGPTPRPILSVAWRRNGTDATSATFASRTLTNFEFYMAHSDYSTLQPTNLDLNYKGAATNCIMKRTLVLPDRSTQPATTPAPWDVVLKFDKPFLYLAKDAFLWEVRYTANTLVQDYSCDYQASTGAGYSYLAGTTVGTACTSTGETSPISFSLSFYNHGTKFRLYRYASRLPKSTPVFLNIDYKNSSLTIPGLCAPLIAMPLISIALGNTSATGTTPTPSYVDNLPYNRYLVGAKLFFQLMALDATRPSGYPVVLSEGKSVVVPTDPAATVVTRFYHYKNSATATTTVGGPWYGGVVTRFGP